MPDALASAKGTMPLFALWMMFLLGKHAMFGHDPPMYLRSTTATSLSFASKSPRSDAVRARAAAENHEIKFFQRKSSCGPGQVKRSSCSSCGLSFRAPGSLLACIDFMGAADIRPSSESHLPLHDTSPQRLNEVDAIVAAASLPELSAATPPIPALAPCGWSWRTTFTPIHARYAPLWLWIQREHLRSSGSRRGNSTTS